MKLCTDIGPLTSHMWISQGMLSFDASHSSLSVEKDLDQLTMNSYQKFMKRIILTFLHLNITG